MTIVSPMGQLRPVFADKNGKRLSGGKVYTYEPGTLTPKATYTDALNLIPNTNPIDLDKYGEADIFLNGDYRIRVVDRHGVLIDDYDNLMAWATKRYLDSALSGFASGANKFYPTLAGANADIANIAVNQVVNIGELENGGLWFKESAESTTLTKAPYDAFELAKQYSNQKQVVQEQYINDLFAAQTQNVENIINQQGVSLQQLDDYYNYLMQRLAQIAVDQGWDASFVVDGDKTQKQINDEQLRFKSNVRNQFLLVEGYQNSSDGYIDDALDEIKAELITKGLMCGGSLRIPRGTWRIKRSHDLSVTGLRIVGDGGRYSSRIIADVNGNYSAGYVIKIAPTSGSTTNGGSGLEGVTLDLNEAPAVGLVYQGAYDVSALHLAEVINGHKDFPCAVIEPHPDGTVLQTLKLDTSGFSKKSVGGTGYVVEVRKAQECIIINSKMFGSPSNQEMKGSTPLLLEDVRGIQIIGCGFANSESHCIDIYAKTRNTTHITIIGPTFEGYKDRAIRTRAESGFTVSRLVCMNERLIFPSAGLLKANSLILSTIYCSNQQVDLDATCNTNVVYTYAAQYVSDLGTYNTVIETASVNNIDRFVFSKGLVSKKANTPLFSLQTIGRTGDYGMKWSASATVDNGAALYTPNGSQVIRFMDDRLGFFANSPVTQRISPATSATDTQKITSIILSLEQLGLFKPAT